MSDKLTSEHIFRTACNIASTLGNFVKNFKYSVDRFNSNLIEDQVLRLAKSLKELDKISHRPLKRNEEYVREAADQLEKNADHKIKIKINMDKDDDDLLF